MRLLCFSFLAVIFASDFHKKSKVRVSSPVLAEMDHEIVISTGDSDLGEMHSMSFEARTRQLKERYKQRLKAFRKHSQKELEKLRKQHLNEVATCHCSYAELAEEYRQLQLDLNERIGRESSRRVEIDSLLKQTEKQLASEKRKLDEIGVTLQEERTKRSAAELRVRDEIHKRVLADEKALEESEKAAEAKRKNEQSSGVVAKAIFTALLISLIF